MLERILDLAKNDPRILAVYSNGSRANPLVPKDPYRDYDIVFVVTETQTFLNNKAWISIFGDIAMCQEPDSNDLAWGADHDDRRAYTWLILFKDGNRLDLGIKVLDEALPHYLSDSLCIKLLDKEGNLPEIPEPSDLSYHIKAPSMPQFHGCCNEFWWCLNNVAKGLMRDQLSYAQRMYMTTVHHELEKMIEWYIGCHHDFAVSTGMWGKYFKQYLTPDLYAQFQKTYAGSDYEDLWKAIFAACDLFRDLATYMGGALGYAYKWDEDKGMMEYLQDLR